MAEMGLGQPLNISYYLVGNTTSLYCQQWPPTSDRFFDFDSGNPFLYSFLALPEELGEAKAKLKSEANIDKMKIQCDVCEKAPATVICCADEAALCARCDIEVHAANKLASKHQRLRLECLSTTLPKCDVCQDKIAYIFCVEDRALLCQDCDEPIHSAGTLSANHQRFLATGIRVGLSSDCRMDKQKTCIEPPNQKIQQQCHTMAVHQASSFTSPWPVDNVLQFSDIESTNKKGSFEFGELDWLADMGFLDEQIAREGVAAAEVPKLSTSQSSFAISNRPRIGSPPNKKPRIAIEEDDHEHFTVPDLG